MGSITNFYDIPGLPELETPDEVAATIAEFAEAGVDLLLLKCSPNSKRWIGSRPRSSAGPSLLENPIKCYLRIFIISVANFGPMPLSSCLK